MAEAWKAIPGYEGFYEASDAGRIRSVRPHPKGSTPALHVLAAQLHRNGYLNVGLRRDGRRHVVGVHRLVAAAFHGAPKPGEEARHGDGCKTNNAASNLRWGTHTENVRDTLAAGKHYSHGRTKTACVNGHTFTPENTRTYVRDGIRRRECRQCRRDISKRARQRAARTNGGESTWQ